jgi:NhaP-type Na+/H+ or K+/H+ antiporter
LIYASLRATHLEKAMYTNLTVLAIFALLYSLVAGRLERTPISGPIVFLSFGLLAGPLGLGWLELDVDNHGLRVLAARAAKQERAG